MNIEHQFDHLHELWSSRVIGRVNDQYVKVAKLKPHSAFATSVSGAYRRAGRGAIEAPIEHLTGAR